jgi:ribosomal protein S18 acetylase RimI-like enzyme
MRSLDGSDLDAIAAIHCAAFPHSLLTKFGHDAVKRYYAWQLLGPQETYTIGTEREGELAGFCFGGVFPVAITGFLQRDAPRLLGRVLTRPRLITDLLSRKRVKNVVRALKETLRARIGPTAPGQTVGPKRPFDILAIAVDPRFQGAGIGKALMREAEETAARNGFRVMTLMVATDNVQAVGFYERIGWEKALMNGAWRGNMVKWLKQAGERYP